MVHVHFPQVREEVHRHRSLPLRIKIRIEEGTKIKRAKKATIVDIEAREIKDQEVQGETEPVVGMMVVIDTTGTMTDQEMAVEEIRKEKMMVILDLILLLRIMSLLRGLWLQLQVLVEALLQMPKVFFKAFILCRWLKLLRSIGNYMLEIFRLVLLKEC